MTTTPDIPTLSKRFAELAGKPWHSQIGTHDGFYKCSCMASFYDSQTLIFHLDSNPNPNFRNPIEVLKVMRAREDWPEFSSHVTKNTPVGMFDPIQGKCPECKTVIGFVPGLSVLQERDRLRELLNYCADETGLLLVEAWKFLEERKERG